MLSTTVTPARSLNPYYTPQELPPTLTQLVASRGLQGCAEEEFASLRRSLYDDSTKQCTALSRLTF
jgi:hypothetical protein